MIPVVVPSKPVPGQNPGTSGLRRKTRIFMRPGYLENYVQSIFDAVGGLSGKSLVLGGDGRFFGRSACQTVIRMAAANGVRRLIVGRNGLLSTPAASDMIRRRSANGGIILSASHNPGGPDADFGVKFNLANGGPATRAVTEAIYDRTCRIEAYRTAETRDVELGRLGETRVGDSTVEIVDPVEAYADLLERLFDFEAIRRLFASGFRMRFDAMNAVMGPYARAILEERLGAGSGTAIRTEPLEDFGGVAPDPNPVHAGDLLRFMSSDSAPDLGAAVDGDGDRHMIVGKACYVSPSDSLAVLASNAHVAPGYADGLKGVARSMPTSRAVDRVAERLGVPAYETPTGWKHFANLLEAGLATICGEESFSAGSDHVREKDGLWSVLLWLNVLAVRNCGVAEILREHWRVHGRDYHTRHDYENVDLDVADALVDSLRERLPRLRGTEIEGLVVEGAEDFAYVDPVDGAVSERQGIRIRFSGGRSVAYRLSGTGTGGATLRVYLERAEPDPARHGMEPQAAIADLAAAAGTLAGIRERTGRMEPDVRT